jgi:hypothetical protein
MSHLFYDVESRQFLYRAEAIQEIREAAKRSLRFRLEMPNGFVVLERAELETMITLDKLPVRLRKLYGENYGPNVGPDLWPPLWEAPAREAGEG